MIIRKTLKIKKQKKMFSKNKIKKIQKTNLKTKTMNKSLIYIKILPVLIILVFANNAIFAQTVMKRDSSIAGNVVVVKKYNPAVLDVHKIPFSPKVVDTVKPEIHFNYFLETRPAQTHYDIMPIHAAKVLPEPLQIDPAYF